MSDCSVSSPDYFSGSCRGDVYSAAGSSVFDNFAYAQEQWINSGIPLTAMQGLFAGLLLPFDFIWLWQNQTALPSGGEPADKTFAERLYWWSMKRLSEMYLGFGYIANYIEI